MLACDFRFISTVPLHCSAFTPDGPRRAIVITTACADPTAHLPRNQSWPVTPSANAASPRRPSAAWSRPRMMPTNNGIRKAPFRATRSDSAARRRRSSISPSCRTSGARPASRWQIGLYLSADGTPLLHCVATQTEPPRGQPHLRSPDKGQEKFGERGRNLGCRESTEGHAGAVTITIVKGSQRMERQQA